MREYFNWLCDKINLVYDDRSYYSLAKIMFETPFYEIIPKDINRIHDAYYLREEFIDEVDDCLDLVDTVLNPDEFECNILELLIGICYRMDSLIVGDESRHDISLNFEILVMNLGLDVYYDGNMDYQQVRNILDNFVERRYHKNGKGGLFPVKTGHEDQRNVEIWYQMNQYLSENY